MHVICLRPAADSPPPGSRRSQRIPSGTIAQPLPSWDGTKLTQNNNPKMNQTNTSDLKSGPTGAIQIERVAPEGETTVQFTVPIRGTTAPPADNAPCPAAPKRSLRVLCIDDDPQVLELLNECLTFFDHRVMIAAGGEEGIGLFRKAVRNNQPYEAVITDLAMPDVDGRQVARAIKEESPGTPIIMMTGWGVAADDETEAAPTVDMVLCKPPRIQELNELLFRIVTPPANQK